MNDVGASLSSAASSVSVGDGDMAPVTGALTVALLFFFL